jgi:DNA adenine methylase
MQNLSPLRYPGGKTNLYHFLSYIIRKNHPIEYYIEPFAGGAGAALSLLINRDVKNIILNDSDEFIYKFWFSVINKNRSFQRKVVNTPVSLEEYKKYKLIYHNHKKRSSISDLSLGFAAFYLNRCNRSGILKAGPIGGYDQKGKWKIDARFNKTDLLKRFEHINDFREQITVYNYDAIYFLKNIIKKIEIDSKKTLVYLDPPYYKQGIELYSKFYKHDEHIALRDFLKNELKIKWILSYDDVPEIHSIYQGIKKDGIIFNHFANKAKIGKELIIASDNCEMTDEL